MLDWCVIVITMDIELLSYMMKEFSLDLFDGSQNTKSYFKNGTNKRIIKDIQRREKFKFCRETVYEA
jgi:hypothetical protein